MKDPFEAACEEQESPPESPIPVEEEIPAADGDDEETDLQSQPSSAAVSAPAPSSSTTAGAAAAGGGGGGRAKEDDEEEEEEENMDVELGKLHAGDPDKMAKMQAILSQFTEEQMSRYESFRRSGFQKANMKRLLASLTGTQKISIPMTIVVSGIAKMFVGELVETGLEVILSLWKFISQHEYNANLIPCGCLTNSCTIVVHVELHLELHLGDSVLHLELQLDDGVLYQDPTCYCDAEIYNSRVVMTERKESGPIRPCHIREAYRRLKLEGKVPRRSVPRLFR